MRLEGSNALVTGASGGLGGRIAQDLARRGARLALTGRSFERLEVACAAVRAEGGAALAIPADLTVAEDRARLLRAVEEQLGPVDVLVNNAGIEINGAFSDVSEEDIERIVSVNLLAPMSLTRLFLPGMVGRASGQIVNVSSIAGKLVSPWSSVYGATKAALFNWSLSLRMELHGTGVGVSVVCPGFVPGEGMFADWATPDDIAAARRAGLVTTLEKVGASVVRAIEHDPPEIVCGGPLGATGDLILALSPRLGEAIARRSPAVAMTRNRARPSLGPTTNEGATRRAS